MDVWSANFLLGLEVEIKGEWVLFGLRLDGVAAARLRTLSGIRDVCHGVVALTQCCVLSKVLAVSVGQY